MPTGYTEYIENGKATTGKDFILVCLRAFGIANDMKDEPLSIPVPKVFEPDVSYYTENLQKALDEKTRLVEINSDDWHVECVKNREERIKDAKRHYDESVELDKKYLKVKHEIEEWNAPEICKEIKKMALEQIKISRPDLNSCLEWVMIAEREEPDEIVYQEYMKSIERDIEYYQEQIAKAVKAAEARTEFMKEMCDSLRESFGEKDA